MQHRMISLEEISKWRDQYISLSVLKSISIEWYIFFSL